MAKNKPNYFFIKRHLLTQCRSLSSDAVDKADKILRDYPNCNLLSHKEGYIYAATKAKNTKMVNFLLHHIREKVMKNDLFSDFAIEDRLQDIFKDDLIHDFEIKTRLINLLIEVEKSCYLTESIQELFDEYYSDATDDEKTISICNCSSFLCKCTTTNLSSIEDDISDCSEEKGEKYDYEFYIIPPKYGPCFKIQPPHTEESLHQCFSEQLLIGECAIVADISD